MQSSVNIEMEQVEDLMLQVADGDPRAVGDLSELLRRQPRDSLVDWSPADCEQWREAAELMLENGSFETSPRLDLLHLMSRIGYDSPLLRDRLAEAARKAFSSYPDPGGLLFALGIRDPGLKVSAIPQRWQLFATLHEGDLCCHPDHGRGSILEIDGFGNEVRVQFERTVNVALAQFLENFHLVHQSSWLADLFRGMRDWSELENLGCREAREVLANSLLPPSRSWQIFRRCLLGSVVNERKFEAFFIQSEEGANSSADLPPEAIRELRDTRSLEELRAVLEFDENPAFGTAEIAAVERLMTAAASRPDQATLFAEVGLHLWEMAEARSWLQDWFGRLEEAAACWRDPDLFFTITDSLPAKRQCNWFGMGVAAIGERRLAELCLELPLKALVQASRALGRAADDKQFFARIVAGALRRGKVSADLVVWLWHHGQDPEKTAIQDPNQVFLALKREVRGALIKANRELRNLLVQDRDFQRFLLQDGDLQAIQRTLNCVRSHNEALDSGERQSLLVRLARLFPEARKLIERKSRKGQAGQDQKIVTQVVTSVRSFERRKRELRELSSVRIPANSQAIAHARSFGDLRENAEYKAAKEEQAHLLQRMAEIERSLDQVKPTDFSRVQAPDRVMPGCTVRLRSQDREESQEFHVMGCWDSEPEHNLISYETALGKALLGKQRGDQVNTPMGMVVLESIGPLSEKWRKWAVATEQD